MAFSKPDPAFDAAATAAHGYVANTLGHAAAAQLQLKPLGQATTQAIVHDWMQAARSDHRCLRRYIIHSNPVLDHLNNQLDKRKRAPDNAFAAALWMGEQLCGVAYGGTAEHQILQVAYVFGRPGQHALQGHVLACTHAAATAFARAGNASCVIYSGPLSAGSVKQVERGALALSVSERNSMWAGNNIITPVDERQIPANKQHVPGQTPPPAYVADDYEKTYMQVFGRPYLP